jgi:geranylgeranyl diphosphate synthase type I
MGSTFADRLIRYAAGIEAHLTAIAGEMTGHAARVHPAGLELAELVSGLTRAPGKRIRPVLAQVAYEGLGGGDGAVAMRAFCALELLQSYFLIHDDIMDRSDTRRGRPTVHREYSERYRGRARDVDHFGQAMGILAGDAAGQQAILLLAQSGCSAEHTIRALARFGQITLEVCYGQALDMILCERPLGAVSEAEVLRVAECKTARYSVELPLHLGAILAGADGPALEHLTAYATPAGIAFQLQDDLLGTFGDEARTGKSADSDLLEGKRTLLVLETWRRANSKQRGLLERVLGNASATPEDLGAARDAIEATGARAAVVVRMGQLVAEAKAALQGPPLNAGIRDFLSELAEYATSRER